MAKPIELPDALRKSIAKQIAAVLVNKKPSQILEGEWAVGPPLATPDASVADASLGESFPIVVLDTAPAAIDTTSSASFDLSPHLKPTGSWHHQIKRGTGPQRSIAGYVHTTDPSLDPAGLGSHKVRGVFGRRLAEKLDSAIEWLDAHLDDDSEARLLSVPTYALYAFVLSTGQYSCVYVVDCPSYFAHLRTNVIYSGVQFIELLRLEEPTAGLVE